MVIALATRSLPEAQRRIAVIGGSAAAVGLRVAFCLVITSLLQIPYLKMVGGLLLLYIGVKLVMPEERIPWRAALRRNPTCGARFGRS